EKHHEVSWLFSPTLLGSQISSSFFIPGLLPMWWHHHLMKTNLPSGDTAINANKNWGLSLNLSEI
ncbi:MAG: hypothetical protein N0E54_10995, partial [Candidatus Thiodiazotropha taylori]|nr:hypothetical protein [Candidatus Thiodiazotropha endolucinida]MCW4229256.1 hypothetical protein [Candidatus Thiodiazotropha taylori]